MTSRNPSSTPGLLVPLSTVNPPTNSEHTISTTANLTEIVLKFANEVGELFRDVPYVNAFTGILLHIITIRSEIQTEKDRCQELIDKILRKSKVILDGLCKAATSPNKDQLKDTKDTLEDYNLLLQNILSTLETTTPKGVRAKLGRLVNRNSRIEAIARYDRLIDDFNANLVTGLLLRSMDPLQPTHASSVAASVFDKPIPRPGRMTGRDQEKSKIIETLLTQVPPRVAILGAGGMGKTTLALTVIYDDMVIERYPSQYFVSCEAIRSYPDLILGIAHALCIPDPKHDGRLPKTILSSFCGGSILCLDNFETVWEEEEIRYDIEEFLSHLDHLSHLAIIMTMRGTQRPGGVSWSEPLLPPLKKLSDTDSGVIFEESCTPADEFTKRLLQVADGIPLAIKLIIAQLREDGETSELLWARWKEAQTKAIGTGHNHRLFNLDASIHLSVYSPRMQADPNAIRVFAMLSNLPNGFPCRQETIEELRSHLPGRPNLLGILGTLQRVSLAYIEGSPGHARYRMLVPIREFGMGLRMESPLDDHLITFYTKLMIRFRDRTDPIGHTVIPSEFLNIRLVLMKALKKDQVDYMAVHASIHFTRWSVYIGNPTLEIINLAKQKSVGMPSVHARCISALSRVYLYQDKLGDAESSLKEVIELYGQVDDVKKEAYNIQNLGEVFLRQDKLDEAEACFTEANELYQRAHSVHGEANGARYLGQVHLRRGKLNEAEECFTRAMKLHQQTQDVLGKAFDVQNLGEVHLQRGKLAQAEECFTKTVELYRRVHSVRGEADGVHKLGGVHLERNMLDEAEVCFTNAMELHRKAKDVLGEAFDVKNLGIVHLRRDRLDEAEECFTKAVKLHQQAHSVLGEAHDIGMLGKVHLQRDKLDEAEECFTRALELHQRAQYVRGEASDVQGLGQVYLRRMKLADAEKYLCRALHLYRQSQSSRSEAIVLKLLEQVRALGEATPIP